VFAQRAVTAIDTITGPNANQMAKRTLLKSLCLKPNPKNNAPYNWNLCWHLLYCNDDVFVKCLGVFITELNHRARNRDLQELLGFQYGDQLSEQNEHSIAAMMYNGNTMSS